MLFGKWMYLLKKSYRNFLYISLTLLFCLVVMALAVRGNPGNPTEDQLNAVYWKDDGPFELSPERGRFILTYSLIENRSFQFSKNLAQFGSPDVAVTKDGKFASLFAPALSFVVIPGYIIGKFFGASQVGTLAVISIFAIINTLLIRNISIRLGANSIASAIASLIFLFAAPAFAYGVSLYQHHISTFLILSSVYLLLRFKGFLSLFLIFFSFSLALTLDYPNLFLMFPIGVIAFLKIFYAEKKENKLKLSIKLPYLLSVIAVIFPLLFFLWFNNASFGNPFQLSGTLQSVKSFKSEDFYQPTIQGLQPKLEETLDNKKTAIGFFKTRNLTNGLYLHFISPDRGIIFYTPVMAFGIIGIILAVRRRVYMTSLLVAIIGANIVLYSLWGDPWGGWAFGSRYLIPSYAILSIFIALFLSFWRKKYFLMPIFAFAAFYSIAVNTLGAITSSALPPQVEVLELEKLSGLVQKYTYERNWNLLLAGHSKSFAYQTFLKDYISTFQFYMILTVSISSLVVLLLILNMLQASRKGDNNA